MRKSSLLIFIGLSALSVLVHAESQSTLPSPIAGLTATELLQVLTDGLCGGTMSAGSPGGFAQSIVDVAFSSTQTQYGDDLKQRWLSELDRQQRDLDLDQSQKQKIADERKKIAPEKVYWFDRAHDNQNAQLWQNITWSEDAIQSDKYFMQSLRNEAPTENVRNDLAATPILLEAVQAGTVTVRLGILKIKVSFDKNKRATQAFYIENAETSHLLCQRLSFPAVAQGLAFPKIPSQWLGQMIINGNPPCFGDRVSPAYQGHYEHFENRTDGDREDMGNADIGIYGITGDKKIKDSDTMEKDWTCTNDGLEFLVTRFSEVDSSTKKLLIGYDAYLIKKVGGMVILGSISLIPDKKDNWPQIRADWAAAGANTDGAVFPEGHLQGDPDEDAPSLSLNVYKPLTAP